MNQRHFLLLFLIPCLFCFSCKIDFEESSVKNGSKASVFTVSISGAPESGVSIGTGVVLTATVSPAVSGTLSYEWYGNTVNANSGGTLISGATGAEYSPETASAGTTYYYCIVTSSAEGNPSAVSSAVCVYVIAADNPEQQVFAVSISGAPESGVSIGTGVVLTATVSPAVSGTLSYEWYGNTVNANSGGTLISGATGAEYSPETASADTTYYYCMVTSSAEGNPSAVSSAVCVYVIAAGQGDAGAGFNFN